MRPKGFSLVELMVVLVIIGIILAFVIPGATRGIEQANKKDCDNNVRNYGAAISMCYSDTRDWSKCNTLALVNAYLPKGAALTCPLSETYSLEQDSTTKVVTITPHTH